MATATTLSLEIDYHDDKARQAVEQWANVKFSGVEVRSTDSGHIGLKGLPEDCQSRLRGALQELADDGVLKDDRTAILITANNTDGIAEGVRYRVETDYTEDGDIVPVVQLKQSRTGLEGGMGEDFKAAWGGKYGLTVLSPHTYL